MQVFAGVPMLSCSSFTDKVTVQISKEDCISLAGVPFLGGSRNPQKITIVTS